MKNPTQSQPNLLIRTATNEDLPQLQLIRQAAFAPVFASFRAILGDEIAAITQANDDAEQAAYLASLFAPDSGWELSVAVLAGEIVGMDKSAKSSTGLACELIPNMDENSDQQYTG